MTAAESGSVLVVGAGVFGVTAALELCRRGHPVVLVDPGPLPHPEASSTDISKAVRMDYGNDAFYHDLAVEALALWDRWPGYHQDGFLMLTQGAMVPDGFEGEGFELACRRGQTVERIDRETLHRRFPAWRTDRFVDGYFNPRGGWAAASEVMAYLLEQATAAGVDTRPGVRCVDLQHSGARVTGIRCDDGRVLEADTVVLAAGAWTPALLPHLADRMWTVGQPVLHFQAADAEEFSGVRFPVWGADITRTGYYGFPATGDGIVKVANHGPGYRMHPHDPKVVGDHEEPRFREFLAEALPALATAPLVDRRLCMYCDTWDGDFWIDHDLDRPGLVVACGGSGHAFKFAPVLGPIIADVVEGRPNRHAARFAWRDRGVARSEQARKRPEGMT